MFPTVFRRPRRQLQRPVDSDRLVHPVRSEDDFRAALQYVASLFDAENTIATFGQVIQVEGQFRVSAPLIVEDKCAGLTIRSLGRAAILPGSESVAALFDVRAPLVTIEGLFVDGALGGRLQPDNKFLEFVVARAGARDLAVHNNVVESNRFYNDLSAGAAVGARIYKNVHVDQSLGLSNAMSLDSPRCSVEGNHVSRSILLGGNGGHVAIRGNIFSATANISTSSGTGGCVIDGNVNVSAIFPRINDVVGDNSLASL
jgi:hypothetical protein